MGSRRSVAAVVVTLTSFVAACGRTPPRADWTEPRVPPDSVESVVFLIGDAGDALPGRSPVVEKLGREVERWSEEVSRDSAIVVLFLGDNVYPEGVRDRDHASFPEDSLKLLSQVLTLAGETARQYRTHGYFLAGNHDWGGRPGDAGLERLRNQAELLEAFRGQGHRVEMVPSPGRPGPVVVDVGARARFIVMDTQWWLRDTEPDSTDEVALRLSESLRSAQGRSVAIATHHPYTSAGFHGGGGSFWDGFGVLWLLRKTGALVQDLNSAPYRELRTNLGRIFREEGAPLLFVGGHDHSLQVIAGDAPDEPRWTLVSGAGSKTSAVGAVAGTAWAAEKPGFMRLTYTRNGAVHLHVFATDEEYKTCHSEGPALVECMRLGAEHFEIVYAATLRPGG